MITSKITVICAFLISGITTSDCSCEYVNTTVECTSINQISDTVISEIPGISEATTISIQRNPRLDITSKRPFRSASKLRSINISFNKINKIYASTFEYLTVKNIYLAYNGIKNIDPGAFADLPYLETLRLNNNNLKEIPKQFLSNLPLNQLTLSENDISTIESKALQNIPNLRKLQIDGNKLQSIFIHEIVSHPHKLENVWLHKNSLTAVTNYMLQKLRNLTLLNLGFNSIAYIESNSFRHTPKLETLVLTHNHLREISGNIFPGRMQSLKRIYLDNNKLMYLSSNFFVQSGSLKKITIVGNPWLCPCLREVEKILAQNGIEEKCNGEYTSGRRPICVNDVPGDTECRYSYVDDLSERYENYTTSYPLIVSPLLCHL